MHITLEFSPQEGTQLREQASRKGSDMGQYPKELIVNNLQVETSETRSKESLLLETINQGLTLSTVHTMKGLEKDIVFLMGMCEGVFPDYRAKTKNEIDEERNNAFVAVTRAKRWLYISYPKQRLMPWGDIRFQQQSRFVREISQ